VDGKLKSERGFALVITLLIAALLVALTVEFVNEVFVDTSARQNFTDGQQASIMAGSGVTAAVQGLQVLQRARPSYTKLDDLEQVAKLLSIEDEKGSLQMTIEDESGKVNLNLVSGSNGQPVGSYDVAKRLLKNAGLSLDLLDTLSDWVDDGSVPPHPAGAKNPYYNTLKPPYDVKSGKMETVEELSLIKGFDAVTVKRLRPFVTVYDDCTSININTAPKEVIAALDDGMTNDLAQIVIDHRPFDDSNPLVNVPGMKSIATGLTTSTTTIGTVYRIISLATVKETTRIVEAVVRISDGHILYWREY
jgi:general secretion pathway protein K